MNTLSNSLFSKPRWTGEEVDLLKEIYPIVSSNDELLKHFPKRTLGAIQRKASADLHVHRKNAKSWRVIYPKLSDHTAMIIAWSIVWEGSISLYYDKFKKRINPIINLSNTNLELLQKFRQLVGFGCVIKGRKGKNGYRDLYYWQLSGNRGCLHLLKEIVEYLPAKQKRAELLIEFCESRIKSRWGTYSDREREILEEFRKLKRGD